MFGTLLAPEIEELIQKRDLATLRQVFEEWPAADLAELFEGIPVQDQVILFRVLPKELATDTFEYLELDAQKTLLQAMGQEQVATVINDMSPDDRTALFEELPSSAVTQLLRLLSPDERRVAQSLLNYPEDSIGRLMTPDFLAVGASWTVAEVLDYIRKHGSESETLNSILVTDERGRLIDNIRIREFLLSSLETKVSELGEENVISLSVTDGQEKAIELFRKYDRNSLPVVDSTGLLVGIVTVDDVLDVIEEETTEDIQKIGGTEALDDAYLATSLQEMLRKRAGWLAVLFIGEMFTASAMQIFQHELERAVILAMFIPLIISSGGNSGSQASTLIIRAMSLGEVHLSDWWRVMRKEIETGLCLGGLLGFLGFLRVIVWELVRPGLYGAHWFLLSLTVGFSLIGVVLWGTLSGSMLPLVLRRIGVDPATSSAPFVATLVDVSGLIIYFTVAMALMRGTVL